MYVYAIMLYLRTNMHVLLNVRHVARGHVGTATLGHSHLASCHVASCHLGRIVKYDILAPLEIYNLL